MAASNACSASEGTCVVVVGATYRRSSNSTGSIIQANSDVPSFLEHERAVVLHELQLLGPNFKGCVH